MYTECTNKIYFMLIIRGMGQPAWPLPGPVGPAATFSTGMAVHAQKNIWVFLLLSCWKYVDNILEENIVMTLLAIFCTITLVHTTALFANELFFSTFKENKFHYFTLLCTCTLYIVQTTEIKMTEWKTK